VCGFLLTLFSFIEAEDESLGYWSEWKEMSDMSVPIVKSYHPR
jgi:hypothetical protein